MKTIDFLLAVGQKGGVENVINDLGARLHKEKGLRVRVVQLVWEGVRWTDDCLEFYPLNNGLGSYTIDAWIASYGAFLDENGDPDVVFASVMPYMSRVARGALLNRGNISSLIISWVHDPIEGYKNSGFGSYEDMVYADVHFAISSYIADSIKNNIPGSTVITVRNPVALKRTGHIMPSEKKQPSHRLLFVGRLAEEKRVEILIKALSMTKNREWSLDVIGGGEDAYEKSLKDLAASLGVSGLIKWHGWVSNPWESEAAISADFIMFASVYEGFPVTAIESLSAGLPVIGTPVSGLLELIEPGVTGYLFQKEDYRGLVEILDAVDAGLLPYCDPEGCTRKVIPYMEEYAFRDFFFKLEQVCCNSDNIKKFRQSDAFSQFGNVYSYHRVSVIVCFYNAERYLRQCIESLVNQSFPMDFLELIFVDDGSTDNSISIVEEYEKKHPDNIMIVRCSENGGIARARNIGLEYATGDYLTFVDSDDYVNQSYLEELYSYCVLYDCDYSICMYKQFDDSKGIVFECKDCFYDMHDNTSKKAFILEWGAKNMACMKFFKRSFLKDNGYTFPEGFLMEDLYFGQLCMMNADRIYTMNKPLYNYRVNPESIMNSKKIKSYYTHTCEMQRMVYDRLKLEGAVGGFEEELELLYYVKSWVEPLTRMMDTTSSVDYDEETLRTFALQIKERFPDILENRYILSDTSDYNKKNLEILERLMA